MIWVIAGTKSGRELIAELLENSYNVIATTATDYGKNLLEPHKNLEVISRRLNSSEMEGLVKKNNIKLIIDASHPYSVELSINAMSVSNKMGIHYLRFERENIQCNEAKNFSRYAEAAEYLKDTDGKILLTIGSKNIGYFDIIDKNRLFARVVPFRESIEECINLGIRPGNIIALSFKFSKEFNKILFKELDIKFLVTKESGEDGGVIEKIDAALESGIEVIIIERPHLDYPEIFYAIGEILNRAGELCHG